MFVDRIDSERSSGSQECRSGDLFTILPSPDLDTFASHSVGDWNLAGEECHRQESEYGSLRFECLFARAPLDEETDEGNDREQAGDNTEHFAGDCGVYDV